MLNQVQHDGGERAAGAGGRPFRLSALLIAGTIAAGLAIRLVPLGLPFVLVKYGGSVLWGLMVYWIVSAIRPRWAPGTSAVVAGLAAFAVELFKLHHTPWLDAFRLTLAGRLLLGRVFSPWDFVAYAGAMIAGAAADRAMRGRRAAAQRRRGAT